MSRFTQRDKYGHAYTNETIHDRGMTSEDGVHFEKHYFENGTSAYDGKPIDRLCESEDKIEQGDVVEVVHGEWETIPDYQPHKLITYRHICSVCKNTYKDLNCHGHNYCHWCGAKMDGERSENGKS